MTEVAILKQLLEHAHAVRGKNRETYHEGTFCAFANSFKSTRKQAVATDTALGWSF